MPKDLPKRVRNWLDRTVAFFDAATSAVPSLPRDTGYAFFVSNRHCGRIVCATQSAAQRRYLAGMMRREARDLARNYDSKPCRKL